MPIYEVEQYETHMQKYRIEAENEAAAIAKVFDGVAEALDGGSEYIEVAEDFGMPVDDHRELADELRDRGIDIGEIIPSIRTIREVD